MHAALLSGSGLYRDVSGGDLPVESDYGRDAVYRELLADRRRRAASVSSGIPWLSSVCTGGLDSLVAINNIATTGSDSLTALIYGASFAQTAVVLAIFCKTKDKKLKDLCIPAAISGFFGVTEPAIYG